MGMFMHHAIIVGQEKMGRIRGKAIEIFGPVGVSEIVSGVRNHYQSVFIAPDGSKEGWHESNEWNEKRAKMVKWLKENDRGLDWAEVQFASEYGKADDKILNSSLDKYESREKHGEIKPKLERPILPYMHSSAPEGMLCADCAMDGEPCPACYTAGWRKKHPNTNQE